MRSNQRDLWDVGLETPVVEGSAGVPCLRIRSESSVPSLFYLFIFFFALSSIAIILMCYLSPETTQHCSRVFANVCYHLNSYRPLSGVDIHTGNQSPPVEKCLIPSSCAPVPRSWQKRSTQSLGR